MICEFKIPTIMWTSILINDCLKIGHFFHQINLSYNISFLSFEKYNPCSNHDGQF